VGKVDQLAPSFKDCFRTRTHNGSDVAQNYLKGLLTMEEERNYTRIEEKTKGPLADGQQIQHFMSHSPWSGRAVIDRVQEELVAHETFQQGGVLILDESAVEKDGNKTVGAARQYNGRLGKIEMSQVGVFLAFATHQHWTWIDGELYLPKSWFEASHAALRQDVGVPTDCTFQTKIDLGWQMVQRAKARNIPFEVVCADDLYGRDGQFRQRMADAQITYVVDVPATTQVFLTEPIYGVPPTLQTQRRQGRRTVKPRVLNGVTPMSVKEVSRLPTTLFHRLRIRPTERGTLNDPFAVLRVWVLQADQVVPHWLIIRHEHSRKYSYSLSNAPATSTPHQLATWKCQRYFVERAIQDAKSELGWDELRARKYLAWEHHLALTILAMWFLATFKISWLEEHDADPEVLAHFELEVLPVLSLANIRELLKATFASPALSREQATELVIKHMMRRCNSTRSRLKKERLEKENS
jgi:SRSO17 transposase